MLKKFADRMGFVCVIMMIIISVIIYIREGLENLVIGYLFLIGFFVGMFLVVKIFDWVCEGE